MKEEDEWNLESFHLIVDLCYGFCILFGVAFNSLIIYVCLRSTLKQVPTFIFITIGAILNSLALFFLPLNSFLERFVLKYNPRDGSIVWCKFSYFSSFWLLHWHVWILVISTLEVYLTVKMINFRPKYSNPRYAVITSLLIGLIFLIYDSPKLLFQGVELDVNGTSVILCLKSTHNSKKLDLLDATLNALFYSFLPTVFTFVLNILLWRELKRSRAKLVKITFQVKAVRNRLENRRSAKTQLTLAFFFLLVSIPRSISTTFYITYKTDLTYLIFKVISLVSTVYYNTTLIILLVQNSAFKKQFYSIVTFKQPNNRIVKRV